MARRKTLPESVRTKLDLAERLAALRLDLYGEARRTGDGTAIGDPGQDLVQL